MMIRRIIQSMSLAALTASLSAAAAMADELNLAAMGEGTSVRVGCGPGFVLNQNFAPVTSAADITSSLMATGLFCLVVAIALRCLPGARRAACWMILRRTAKTYFILGPVSAVLTIIPLAMFGAGDGAFGITTGLWLASAVTTACCAFGELRKDWNLLKQKWAAAKQPARVEPLPVVVRVEADYIVFMRADGTEIRMVFPAQQCEPTPDAERPACLTK